MCIRDSGTSDSELLNVFSKYWKENMDTVSRTLAVMMVLQTTAQAPSLPPVVETVLCTQIPQLVAEISTDSVFLALRHIEDDDVRADLTRFAVELASRSVDMVGAARTALLQALKP